MGMRTIYLLLFPLFLFFIVSCTEDEVDPNFSIENVGDVVMGSAKGSQVTISFTSTREWKASTVADWFTIAPVSGEAGTCNITLTAISENITGSVRTATLTLTSGTLTQDITIEQESAEFVNLEQNIYNVSVEGGELDIRFSTNIAEDELLIYGSLGTGTWLTQETKTRASSSYMLNLTVLPNTDGVSRTAYIYFVKVTDMESIVVEMVTIIQRGEVASESTDYSSDKKVRVLQTAKLGKGLPIVLMGDGFIDTEINDGTYDAVMDKAFENLFTEEPIKSLRDYFNVYAVTAVSKHNIFGTGYETALGCELAGGNSTGISGEDNAVQRYVQCVDNIDMSETLAVVILNSPAYAGTTYFGYTNQTKVVEFAIAYCPVIYDLQSESFRQVLVHEAVGHGFAKLEDEYAYQENGTISSKEIKNVQYLQTLGWAQNVDFTSDPSQVLWSAFLNDNRYVSEKLGVFEGACTYIKGAYRPSEESMMNSNTEGFCWNNVLTTYMKCKKKEKTVQSTESMSFFSCVNQVPEFYLISLMNSRFAAIYVDNFINSTSHCTTGDAKLIPVLIPDNEILKSCNRLFTSAFELKKSVAKGITTDISIQSELEIIEEENDNLIACLYSI